MGKASEPGWWNIFRKPEVDQAGQWSIDEECTKTGLTTVHLYDDEAAASAAYQGMLEAMLNGKVKQ